MSAKTALLLSFSVLAGCSMSGFPLKDRAADEGLERTVVGTAFFEHHIYRKPGNSTYQSVFIEGDGRPWSSDGRRPSRDPTPGDALAFDLMLATPSEAIYITRPCYFETWNESCPPSTWTSGRFSANVVSSLAEAIDAATDPNRPVVVVGYSGGGALAIVAATELDRVDAVVTVAGLLNSKSWTDYHGYEPLSESIDPASRSTDVRRIHLHGALDDVVPIELVREEVTRSDDTELRAFDAYGHVCCWREDWPRIWEDIEVALDLVDYEQSDSSNASQ